MPVCRWSRRRFRCQGSVLSTTRYSRKSQSLQTTTSAVSSSPCRCIQRHLTTKVRWCFVVDLLNIEHIWGSGWNLCVTEYCAVFQRGSKRRRRQWSVTRTNDCREKSRTGTHDARSGLMKWKVKSTVSTASSTKEMTSLSWSKNIYGIAWILQQLILGIRARALVRIHQEYYFTFTCFSKYE